MINPQERGNPPERPTRAERALERIMTTYGSLEDTEDGGDR